MRVGMGEVRAAVEAAFSYGDLPGSAELPGARVLDGRRLAVVYRDVATGDLQRVVTDVEALRVGVPAEALDRLVDEVVTETLHPLSFKRYLGADRWGVREWDDGPAAVED